MNVLSPLVSEFETLEQAEAHLRWLEAKVAAARADGRPDVEHDEAMARTRAIIEAHRPNWAERKPGPPPTASTIPSPLTR
jgi:hypothetical protein